MKKEEITKFLNTILKWSVMCSISHWDAKKDFKDLGVMIIMFMIAHKLEIENKDYEKGARNKNEKKSLQ